MNKESQMWFLFFVFGKIFETHTDLAQNHVKMEGMEV